MADFKQTINGATSNVIPEAQGVKIAPPTSISVLIVGAGVGGLTAALECTRKGHSVRVFEREANVSAAGDMFTIGISGRRWFLNWPNMAKEFAQISPKGAFMEYHKHSGEIMIPAKSFADTFRGVPSPGPDLGPPMIHQLRPLFHSMLYRQLRRIGIDVTCGKRVVEYFESDRKGGVVTDDGERAEADLVIAADGIGSKAQVLVMGDQVRGKFSGRSVYRTAYPLEHAFKDPLVKKHFDLIEGKPAMRAFYGPETHGIVLTTPKMMVWAVDHKATEGGSEQWNQMVSNDDVQRTMDEVPGWAGIFRALVNTTPPNKIIDYPLVFRDPQPKWASPAARVLTLGDSAHTFLPTSGNGATQAIEDAVSIASCLQLGGKDNIPTAVRAHAKLRFERVANAQRLGFINKQRVQFTDWEAVKQDPGTLNPLVPRWIFTHDPEKYVYEKYNDVVASLTEGREFKNTNVPPGSEFKPWTMEEMLDDMMAGRKIEKPGDWS